MVLKIKLILASLVLSVSTCDRKTTYDDMYASCDTSYQTSDTYFTPTSKLTFRLRFVYFADSINEEQVDYQKVLSRINNFYKIADFNFELDRIDTIVAPGIKDDMPSYVKYHFKMFKDDNAITCYIYGNHQPNYSDDRKFTAGSAGGIGSKFFAIRKMFTDSVTVNHELGHCFSLLHTSIPSTSNTPYTIYDSDLVCDTRAVDNLEANIDDDCQYIGEEDLTEEEKAQVACNYMSRNYMKCRHCITNGQIRKMRFYVHESPDMRMTISKGLKTEIY